MRQTAVVRRNRQSRPGRPGRPGLDWLGKHATESGRALKGQLEPTMVRGTEAGARAALRPILALGGVITAVVTLQVVWLLLDGTPMAFVDSYAYLSRLLYTMHSLGEADRLGELAHAFDRLSLNGRPPVYQLLAGPVLWLLGKTEDAATVVNLAFLAVGAIAIYRLAALAGQRWAGVLAAGLYLTYPPVVALNHEFLPHAVVPTLIATTLWNLVVLAQDSASPRAWRWWPAAVLAGHAHELAGWLLFAQITLGALIHPSYLGMVVVPVAVVLITRVGPGLWARVRSVPSRATRAEGASRVAALLADRSLRRVWLPAGLLSVVTVSLWYLGPGAVILEKYRGFKGQALVAFRRQQYLADGFREQAGPGWYVETASAALSKPLAVMGALAIVWALSRMVWSWRRQSGRRGGGIGTRALILLGLLWIVTVIHLGETAFAWWKMAPALPMLALLTALAVTDLPGRLVRRVAVVAVASICLFNLVFVLFGGGEAWMASVARGFGARLDSDTCTRTARHACVYCPLPPRQEQWPSEAFVATVRAQTETVTDTDPGNNEIMIVGGPVIRPALFAFWLAKHWPDHGYRVRGTGYMNWGYPYNLRALLETRFILFAPQPVRKRAKAYVPITLRLLMSPPPSFARAHEEIAVFPLRVDPIYRSVKELRLLRRVGDLTVTEAEEVIAHLELAPEYLRQAPVLLEEIRTGDRVHLRGRRR